MQMSKLALWIAFSKQHLNLNTVQKMLIMEKNLWIKRIQNKSFFRQVLCVYAGEWRSRWFVTLYCIISVMIMTLCYTSVWRTCKSHSRDCSDSPFAHAASLSPPFSWPRLGPSSAPCSGTQSCLRKVQQAVPLSVRYLPSLCLSRRHSVFLTAVHSPYTREIHVAYHGSLTGSQSSPCLLWLVHHLDTSGSLNHGLSERTQMREKVVPIIIKWHTEETEISPKQKNKQTKSSSSDAAVSTQ